MLGIIAKINLLTKQTNDNNYHYIYFWPIYMNKSIFVFFGVIAGSIGALAVFLSLTFVSWWVIDFLILSNHTTLT